LERACGHSKSSPGIASIESGVPNSYRETIRLTVPNIPWIQIRSINERFVDKICCLLVTDTNKCLENGVQVVSRFPQEKGEHGKIAFKCRSSSKKFVTMVAVKFFTAGNSVQEKSGQCTTSYKIVLSRTTQTIIFPCLSLGGLSL
jgi:hypothetical protein